MAMIQSHFLRLSRSYIALSMKILSKIEACTHVTINTLGNIRSKTHFVHMLAQKSFAVDKLVSVTSILPPRVINKCLMCNRT